MFKATHIANVYFVHPLNIKQLVDVTLMSCYNGSFGFYKADELPVESTQFVRHLGYFFASLFRSTAITIHTKPSLLFANY